jgi:hypothetical protein
VTVHATIVRQMQTDTSIQTWLDRREARMAAAIAKDDPAKHRHVPGLGVNCCRCGDLLDEHDRAHPFDRRAR